MPVYQYKVRNRKGELEQGSIEADDMRKAVELLRSRGVFVVEIKQPGQGLQREVRLPSLGGRVGLKNVAVFARQMATLIQAGITLTHALSILEEQEANPAMRKILKEVRQSIEGGSSFTEAISQHKVFSRLFIGLVRAGEAAGRVETVLDRIATFLEKELALRGKIRTAMTYPTIVLVFAVAISYFLLAFIVPQFARILSDLGSELPLLTRFLIAVSEVLRKGFPFLALSVFAAWMGIRMVGRNPKGRLALDALKLKFPVFGPLVKKSAVGSFSRTLALLLSGGVGAMEALEIAEESANNKVVEGAIREVRRGVEQGEGMHPGLKRHPALFPPMVVSMVAIGEETGSVDTMLSKVADFYEREVEEAVASLSAAIEPLLIVFLGGIVGLIVVGMFLPLFQVISTLSTQ